MRFIQSDLRLRLPGDLLERGGHAAAGRVAQHVHRLAVGLEQRCGQGAQGGAVAADVALQVEPFAAGQYRHAVIADSAVDQHLVADPGAAAANVELVIEDADPRGVDKDLVALAARNHLGVAGNDARPGLFGRLLHRLQHRLQFGDRQALLEDQADADRQRPRPGHGQVVDRAVDRQVADVAPGKDDRVDHVGVGGVGEPAAVVGEDRRVVLVALRNSGQGGDDEIVEQLVAELAAAAVAEKNNIGFQGKTPKNRSVQRKGRKN